MLKRHITIKNNTCQNFLKRRNTYPSGQLLQRWGKYCTTLARTGLFPTAENLSRVWIWSTELCRNPLPHRWGKMSRKSMQIHQWIVQRPTHWILLQRSRYLHNFEWHCKKSIGKLLPQTTSNQINKNHHIKSPSHRLLLPRQHNSHRIIENTLSKHKSIQIYVHVKIIENSQNRDRIRGRDESTKVERVQKSEAGAGAE